MPVSQPAWRLSLFLFHKPHQGQPIGLVHGPHPSNCLRRRIRCRWRICATPRCGRSYICRSEGSSSACICPTDSAPHHCTSRPSISLVRRFQCQAASLSPPTQSLRFPARPTSRCPPEPITFQILSHSRLFPCPTWRFLFRSTRRLRLKPDIRVRMRRRTSFMETGFPPVTFPKRRNWSTGISSPAWM